MKTIARFIYNLNRLALLLLALAFLSFYLVTKPELAETVSPVVTYATQYLPILLVPVAVAMIVVLLMRYVMKRREESINFGDILAGVLAIAGQIGVIALYRAQGSEVLNSSFLIKLPDVTALAEKAVPLGILGVAGLQLVTFFLYWVADPNKRGKTA
ncbi:MAG: hypothetical protein P1V20_00155 [Verrucomicrobiales bacterium]|nr:hypothetical protein [Verrucomicrobiales bacterium]